MNYFRISVPQNAWGMKGAMKHPSGSVLQKACSGKVFKIHRKTHVLQSHFNLRYSQGNCIITNI